MNTIKRFFNFKNIIAIVTSLIMLVSISISVFAKNEEIPSLKVEPMLINIEAFEEYDLQFYDSKPAVITSSDNFIDINGFFLCNGDVKIRLPEHMFIFQFNETYEGVINVIIDFDYDQLSKFISENIKQTLNFSLKSWIVFRDNNGNQRVCFSNIGEIKINYFVEVE